MREQVVSVTCGVTQERGRNKTSTNTSIATKRCKAQGCQHGRCVALREKEATKTRLTTWMRVTPRQHYLDQISLIRR